jgi:type II secretory pathway pseudopilin PulG
MKKTTQQLAERPAGFVLLTTMIVLVVLASLTTGLALQLSMAKRRQQYMIEYQRARYGLDSAMKYILRTLPTRTFSLSGRQEQPDFSDLFLMNQQEYAAFIAAWAETATDEQIEAVLKEGASLTQPSEHRRPDIRAAVPVWWRQRGGQRCKRYDAEAI